MAGRGRGEAAKIQRVEEEEASSRYSAHAARDGGALPVLDVEGSSSSGSQSSSSGEKTIRGRGGFRSKELHTIPKGVTLVKAKGPNASGQPCTVLANYFKIEPMKDKQIYSYRIDFEPNIESISLRSQLFKRSTSELLSNDCMFDGMSEARSSVRLPDQKTSVQALNPADPANPVTITLKMVGEVSYGTFEMMRVYNIHMKTFLRTLGFFSVSSTGAYVNAALSTPVGQNTGLVFMRGYRTAANVHQDGDILMNLESVHKIFQQKNVLELMTQMKNESRGDFKEYIKSNLIGKLVLTNYNKVVYRIEDVNFTMTPKTTFPDRASGKDISYMSYYQTKYGIQIRVDSQPMLLVVPNNRRRLPEQQGGEQKDIYVVPELCNIAGLTDAQRNNGRLKFDLIKSSQIDPKERVAHMETFLKKLHDNEQITTKLKSWGYSYGREAVSIKARIMPCEAICSGRNAGAHHDKWPRADAQGSFESIVTRDSLLRTPPFPKLTIVISKADERNEKAIIEKLKNGFGRIGLRPANVQTIRMQGDSAHNYVQNIKNLTPDNTATIVILQQQNKERYDAVKKLASVEMGLVTQVVTSKLMMDDRKAGGAAIKIGVQVAAKIGGEPWQVFLPLPATMICGYDTYHDTANRGRSYGAFVASMNGSYSRWFSKADAHDHIDELSSHMAENLAIALNRWTELNQGKKLQRVFIYRDGVGESQLEHVFKTEVSQIRQAIKTYNKETQLAVIIVNKRIGARFYLKNPNGYSNPPPGTVIDDVVTRQERYDFYLVSQSTRNGTVAPTYYNIIHDETGLECAKHQAMAYKLCFMYYNWTGTVRVPAPCQYAHKLALLCGEHLHAVPNANLDDRLHFL